MVSDRTLERILPSPRAVALYGDLVRAAVAGLLLLIIATALIYYSLQMRIVVTDLHMNDFGKFYYSTREWLAGRDMYGPTLATAIPMPDGTTRQFLNMNPPHFQLLMVPLAVLPPMTALFVWWALSLLALGASVRVIAREIEFRWTPHRAIWFAFFLIVPATTGTVVVTGQLTFLLLLPVTLAWVAARHGRWDRAAVILGLLASVKPFLGIFALYFAVARRWRALAFLMTSAAAALLAGVLILGEEPYWSWLQSLRAVEWAWAPMNASVFGVFARALGPSPFFAPLFDRLSWIAPLAVVASVLVIAVTLFMTSDDATRRDDRAFAGLLLGAQLASPLGWVYYSWLVAGPAAALVLSHHAHATRPVRWLCGIGAAGLFCPLFLTIAGNQFSIASLAWGSVYAWSSACLWFVWLLIPPRTTAARLARR